MILVKLPGAIKARTMALSREQEIAMTFLDQPCLVMTTAADQAAAERIGLALLTARLAACVQYETIVSQYVWQGEICTDSEVRLLIKTLRSRYEDVEQTILALHDYDCPQIVWLGLDGGSEKYVQWLRGVVEDRRG